MSAFLGADAGALSAGVDKFPLTLVAGSRHARRRWR